MASSISSIPSPSSSSASASECLASRRKPRVSAEHTLNRVRENQRRHRARRKDYMASLEQKVQELETQLAEAKKEIENLRAERENGGATIIFRCAEDGRKHDDGEATQTGLGVSNIGEGAGGSNKQHTLSLIPLPAAIEHPDVQDPSFLSATNASTSASLSIPVLSTTPISSPTPAPNPPVTNLPTPLPRPITTGPPPCCSDPDPSSPTSTTSDTADSGPECSTCATRPAPSPSESTTLCSQAYLMISQQNVRNIDAGTIRLWLWQGYRRAQRQGEGCRVENGVLMSLLDFISGV